MKRDDIPKAVQIERELSALETKRSHFEAVEKFEIISGCCLSLQDYPEPSKIGAAFREVRAAIVGLLDKQIAGLRKDLEAIGVQSDPR